ncbi:unnamed protein product [Cylicocyclus nassatus]|uniref:Uncharacterized protein n=1 Tax=Cylicocyclus nassatus TaxID=53992 RepID=A0AA36H0Z9_CYLNA|nr:unnamed protein product [Cylicocyclus nassatus]
MNMTADFVQIEEHSMRMTFAMQGWLILFVLPLSALAIRCYSDTTTGDSKPTSVIECDSEMCYKISMQTSNAKAAQYGCGAICTSNSDSCTKTNEVTQCCCKNSLCNSSKIPTLLFTLSSFITLILLK